MTLLTFIFLFICLMPSRAILFPPMNLTVTVLDFKATAEWLPGPENPPGTRYTMEFIPAQYISRGNWNQSENCFNITMLKCDLTFDQQPEELFWNYFVRVKTTFKGKSSNWTTISKSFQPYGDTRLSPPDVKISTDQQSIIINFSHQLELHSDIKPLEFLLCLFENDPVGSKSKFVALSSTSNSSHIFHDVPHGRNYCVNVSASHQQALRKNNFNATKCVFLSDSFGSLSGLLVWIGITGIIAVVFAVTFIYFYQKRFKIKDLHIPGPLFVIPGTIKVLELSIEKFHIITLIRPNAISNTEECVSAFEEDHSQFYHQREYITNMIMISSPVCSQAAIHQTEPVDEAEPLNQYFSDYRLATYMEDSEETVISENDNGDMHSGATVSSFTSTSNLSPFTVSETPQINTVSTYLNRDEEETESQFEMCSQSSGIRSDDEDDGLVWDDSFSGGGYEPRADPWSLANPS